MQRIKMLLQKINEIAHKGDNTSLIEIDLMMDYARVMYADMAEMRNKLAFRDDVPNITAATVTAEKVEVPQAQEEIIVPTATAEQKPAEPITQVVLEPVAETITTIPQPIIRNNKASIEQLIGINDKYQFINELFNNNNELYETTIKEIGDFDSYQQAIDWLGSNFSWNIEDDTVQSLYSIISRHYNQ
eukprot:TRINITY_DN83979_c0_g1_i1.p1 TRINITY_DN83979_c0_g1~~TRINITY_DN83979_c0_g1_i1.p1  ORF type:complete len:188 (+),score=37.63 TRINITY_DN83979_c0_g1_i1:265-828(+)